jgi:hypothetical protein
MAKKRTKAPLERGRGAKSDKYHPSHAELAKMMIVELGAVNNRGEVAWGKIAKLLRVSVETLRRWRTRSGPYYRADFAAAVTQAIEEIDAGKIKRSMIQRAQGYTQRRTVTEIRDTPDGEITVNRTEKTTLAGDVQAAKLVLPNIGDPETRWMAKEGRMHDVGGTLADLMREIGENPEPFVTEGSGEHDGEAVQAEPEQPILATEPPVLDHG